MSSPVYQAPRKEVIIGPSGGLEPPKVPAPPARPAEHSIASVAPAKESNLNKAKRFYADTPPMLKLMLWLSGIICMASFVVSYAGLYSAAEWALGPVWFLQAVVPFMLDFAIITFTVGLFIERERQESVKGSWTAIAIFALISSYANILHALEVGTGTTVPQVIMGCLIAGGAPIMLAFVTDKVAIRAFKPLVVTPAS